MSTLLAPPGGGSMNTLLILTFLLALALLALALLFLEDPGDKGGAA